MVDMIPVLEVTSMMSNFPQEWEKKPWATTFNEKTAFMEVADQNQSPGGILPNGLLKIFLKFT